MNFLFCDTYYVEILSTTHKFNEFIILGITGDTRNGDNIEKFINIDIYSNIVFLQILSSPVTIGRHGVTAKLSAGNR